jgi:ribosome maturation factor RimP
VEEAVMSQANAASRPASKSAPKAALIDLLTPVAAAAGVDLEDVAVSRAGSRSLVRVVIDRDGGLDLDAVAEVSHAVSAALDADEAVMPGAFVLEVTTPGVDRPLTEPRHWRRARGRLVAVTRRSGGAVVGRVQSADEAGAVIAGTDLPGGELVIGYADVSRAVVQVEFNGPPGHDTALEDTALDDTAPEDESFEDMQDTDEAGTTS